MLSGRHQLRRIEGLQCVPHLDVLDLHSNAIERIEGLAALRELRRVWCRDARRTRERERQKIHPNRI
jgi:hypothetical protein